MVNKSTFLLKNLISGNVNRVSDGGFTWAHERETRLEKVSL